MKIKEIILERSTDLVARYHHNPSEMIDRNLNPEANEYRKETQRHYEEHPSGDTSWDAEPNEKEWNSRPEPNAKQSAGYRGLQYAFSRSGIPYDKEVQKYNPNFSGYDLEI